MDVSSDSIIDKLKSKNDNLLTKKKAILLWIQTVLAQKQNMELCNLMNIINNNCILKIKLESGVFSSIENLNLFVNACKDYGIQNINDFNPYNFIMEAKNSEEKFIQIMKELCLTSVERGFSLPDFNIEKFKSSFEDKKDMQDSSVVRRISKNYMNMNINSMTFSNIGNKELSGQSVISPNHSKEPSQISTSLKSPIILEEGDKIEVLNNYQNNYIEKLAANTLNGLDIMNQQLEAIQVRLEKAPSKSFGISKGNSLANINTNGLQTSSSTSCITAPPESRKQSLFFASSANTNENSAPTPQLQYSTLPENIIQMNLSRQENMRLMLFMNYLQQKQIICLMENISKSKLLSEKEFNWLFSNVKDLVVVNKEFNDNLVSLKENDPVIPEIGNEFLKIAEKLKTYKEYCSNYPSALSLLRELNQKPEIKNLLTKLSTENAECRGLSLESFLIKPVQRICKYPLMIKELLKYTSKDSKDHPILENSLTVIENVIAYVNEGTKALEEKERLSGLQARIELSEFPDLQLKLADKHMIKEGNVQRLINSKAKDRHMLLFNDCLLICKDWTASYKYKYQLEEFLPINSIILKNEIKGHTNVFQLISKNKKIKPEKLQNGNNSSEQPISISLINDLLKKEWTQSIWDTITESKKIQREIETSNSNNKIDLDIDEEINITIRKKEEFPSLVEFNGVKWKKAVAATGQNYYFNTVTFDSIWRLPNEYYIIDSETGEKYLHNETENEESNNTETDNDEDNDGNYDGDDSAGDNDEDDDEYYNSENVEGYPDWKIVKMENNITYYFNKYTKETQWEHPKSNFNNEDTIDNKKTIQQLQNILINVSPTQ
ncbi:Dbl homology domain-containing protein [Piromyces finnis]|uniref:Dbl homology domain-containing protein n=1 Tax=Piromyces finnis TaxID=1754191 RepID=A0A1Y1U6R8_9FUNG|nr:Dbl homology domain-containing protein [Piromyces finnis]|eukprot:ORX33708.1 Dbl homology domain-containing protein [Piromyces finnis]